MACAGDQALTQADAAPINSVDVGLTDTSGDTGAADTTPIDSSVPDTSAPETADTGVADTAVADTGSADTGVADTGTPDTGTPDTGVVDTAPEVAPDTGATCSTGSWFDFAGASCATCPDSGKISLACASFDLSSGKTTYDPAKKQLTLVLRPGIAQVTSGTIEVGLVRASGTTRVTVPLTAIANMLIADLSAAITSDVTGLDHVIRIATHEACGGDSLTIDFHMNTSASDAGAFTVSSYYCSAY